MNKKIYFLIAIVLFFIVSGTALYLIFRSTLILPEREDEEEVIEEEFLLNIDSPQRTEGWFFFADQDFNFELNYPRELRIEVQKTEEEISLSFFSERERVQGIPLDLGEDITPLPIREEGPPFEIAPPPIDPINIINHYVGTLIVRKEGMIEVDLEDYISELPTVLEEEVPEISYSRIGENIYATPSRYFCPEWCFFMQKEQTGEVYRLSFDEETSDSRIMFILIIPTIKWTD